MAHQIFTPTWLAMRALRHCLNLRPNWRWPIKLIWDGGWKKCAQTWYIDESPLWVVVPTDIIDALSAQDGDGAEAVFERLKPILDRALETADA